MRDRSYYRRRIWLDVAAVVLLLALVLVPLVFLATEMMGGSNFGGGRGSAVVSGGGGSAYVPAAPRSSFSAWKQRRSRSVGRTNPLVGSGPFGGSVGGSVGEGSAVPFSPGWRAEATPNLSEGADASNAGRAFAVGGTSGRVGPNQAPTGGASGSYAVSGRSSSRASSGASGSAAEAQRFASRARALSRQLGQVAQDPVRRSLGEEAVPSGEASGRATVEGPTSSATSNPPLPEEPTLPIDDHVHWLLAAGLLWGVWRLARG